MLPAVADWAKNLRRDKLNFAWASRFFMQFHLSVVFSMCCDLKPRLRFASFSHDQAP